MDWAANRDRTREQAESFANAEVGANWTVVYIKGGK